MVLIHVYKCCGVLVVFRWWAFGLHRGRKQSNSLIKVVIVHVLVREAARPLFEVLVVPSPQFGAILSAAVIRVWNVLSSQKRASLTRSVQVLRRPVEILRWLSLVQQAGGPWGPRPPSDPRAVHELTSSDLVHGEPVKPEISWKDYSQNNYIIYVVAFRIKPSCCKASLTLKPFSHTLG